MKPLNLILIVPLTASCVGLVVWLSSGVSSGEKASEAPSLAQDVGVPTVITVLPRLGEAEQTLQVPGSLEAYEIAKLQAKVTGYLEEIHVDIGDDVKKGDLLAKLSIPEMAPELETARAEMEAARARFEKAKADAELASVTHERVRDLYASEPGAISRQDVDIAAAQEKVAEAAAEVARSEVELAKSKTDRLRAIMAYATINAPFDGKVTRRFAHTGALMSGGDPGGQPIVEVVRTDKLRLAVEIPEVAVPHVRIGTEVQIVVGGLPGESITGQVARLSGTLGSRSRNRRVEIDLDTREGKLLPGMYATVHLDLRSFDNSITLPATAVQKLEGHTCVYTVEDGQLATCPVAILMDNGKNVVVTGELSAATPVVVSMPRLVKAGDEVQAKQLAESAR